MFPSLEGTRETRTCVKQTHFIFGHVNNTVQKITHRQNREIV